MWAVAAYLLAAWYFSFWPFEKSDQDADFHVYFYYPGGKEAYLGRVEGLSACGDLARTNARLTGVLSSSSWSYVCCKITKDSSCESKHR